jgi:catechol 2,3-dioxygenase-like lactoylglutathione lyase family enzyme
MGIFTHNCVGTNDVERSGRFYDACLAPLGITRLGDFLDQGLAYGDRAAEFLVLRPINGEAALPGNGVTIGFKAPDRQSVSVFHAAGLATGGIDAGAPGPRGAVPHAFGAYLLDPDGNKICAYCFKASAG